MSAMVSLVRPVNHPQRNLTLTLAINIGKIANIGQKFEILELSVIAIQVSFSHISEEAKKTIPNSI